MTDRFDLEQGIMNCWNVVDDIEAVRDFFAKNDALDKDVADALNGLKTLYQIKFETLFSTFETLVRQGELGKGRINRNQLIDDIRDLQLQEGIYPGEYLRGYLHAKDDAITIIETQRNLP